jgi:hypothetical protein
MTRRQRRSLTPELKIEASRHMRTCLYGEFQDSEDFEVGFVDVTDELNGYMSEFHDLIANLANVCLILCVCSCELEQIIIKACFSAVRQPCTK